MFKKAAFGLAILGLAMLTGCASVPMESAENDATAKAFPAPAQNQSGLYIVRDSSLGSALKKTIKIDGEYVGESAPHTYFYRLITPGEHTLATQSEFSDNLLVLKAAPGKNHFVRQSIKMGLFVGGAKLTEISEDEGKKAILESKLAK
jgi:hypothetical protein